MSEQLDRVLAVLDVGLQSSRETGYGTDRAPDACSRCQANEPVQGGDLCEGCRAYLLGDAADPMEQHHLDAQHLDTRSIYETARRPIHHANGLPVIGGIMDGSCIAAEGHIMEVPILRPITYRCDDPNPMLTFDRESYRRERFRVRDQLLWAWVHEGLTGEQAARRLSITDITGS